MNWQAHLAEFWPHLVAGFSFLASLLASIHAVLNKRDSRAAALWLGFIWLVPFVGPLLYLAGHHVAEPGRPARRAGGHHFAGQEQPAGRALGVPRNVVAGARTRLSHLP